MRAILPGHLRLEGEQILGAPVEAFRPDVCAGLRIDELGVHAHLVVGTSHAALEDVAYAQFPTELPDVHDLATVGLHGVPCNHKGPLDT